MRVLGMISIAATILSFGCTGPTRQVRGTAPADAPAVERIRGNWVLHVERTFENMLSKDATMGDAMRKQPELRQTILRDGGKLTLQIEPGWLTLMAEEGKGKRYRMVVTAQKGDEVTIETTRVFDDGTKGTPKTAVIVVTGTSRLYAYRLHEGERRDELWFVRRGPR